MLQYSHRGPPKTGAASEVSPLKLRLGPPCEGCPESNQQGAQQKAPLHQRGPLAINRSTALGMGDKLSSLQAPPQGHHQRSAKKKQSPIFHFAVGLACAAWAVWGCLGCLGLQQQAGTTALGEGRTPRQRRQWCGSGRSGGSWIASVLGHGPGPLQVRTDQDAGLPAGSWECEIGQVRSSADRPGTCRLPRPKLETSQSCSCD